MANDVETFLKYVLERSEEIGIHQENRGDSETFVSELAGACRFTRKDCNFCMKFRIYLLLTIRMRRNGKSWRKFILKLKKSLLTCTITVIMILHRLLNYLYHKTSRKALFLHSKRCLVRTAWA